MGVNERDPLTGRFRHVGSTEKRPLNPVLPSAMNTVFNNILHDLDNAVAKWEAVLENG